MAVIYVKTVGGANANRERKNLLIKLCLHNSVTPEKLIKAGFKQQSEDKLAFRMREKLYKNSIYLSLKINLSSEAEKPLEWYVIDNNTGLSYNTFYFSPNNCKDLVREAVYKSFNEIVDELDKREILYEENK